jgi:hypothetical protein
MPINVGAKFTAKLPAAIISRFYGGDCFLIKTKKALPKQSLSHQAKFWAAPFSPREKGWG